MKQILLSACAIAAIVAPAMAAENWSTDLPAALAQAAKEGKAVLVDFNGSDWCGPCMMLKSKVLATPEFAAYAADKLVLVDVDMPRGNIISPEQKKINSDLVIKYAITGFPTILVMTKDGVVLGGFIGDTDKIAKVQSDIDAALANGPAVEAALSKAASLAGVEKAQALMAAYNLAPEELREQNAELKAQIIANDPEDTCGFAAIEKTKDQKVVDRKACFVLVNSVPIDQRAALLSKELDRRDVTDYYKSLVAESLINVQLMACTTVVELASVKTACKAYAAAHPSLKDGIEAVLAQLDNMGDEAVLKYLKSF